MKNITKAQLNEAIELWESFDRALAIRGMRLTIRRIREYHRNEYNRVRHG